jgi:ABC-2 type transport system ATP-binding protein
VTAHTERPVDVTDLPGITGLEIDGTRLAFDVDNAHLGQVLDRLADGSVSALTCTPPTLEELFLRHYDDRADAGDARTERR